MQVNHAVATGLEYRHVARSSGTLDRWTQDEQRMVMGLISSSTTLLLWVDAYFGLNALSSKLPTTEVLHRSVHMDPVSQVSNCVASFEEADCCV